MNVAAKRRLLGIAAAGVLLSLTLALFDSDDRRTGAGVEVAAAARRSFRIAVDTVGVLDAARSQIISSSVRGNKGKIIYLIEDGAWVKQGDVLMRLDPTPFEEEVARFNSEVQKLASAVEAANQMLEWEKNQLESRIASAEYNRRVAELEAKRLVDGDGPLQLAQYGEEQEKARIEASRYEAYAKDLEELGAKGYPNPTELARARENATTFREKFNSAERRFSSYKQYVLPSLLEAAKAKVQNAERELEQMRKGALYKIANVAEEKNQLAIKLQTERENLELARDELAKTTIRAPIAGIVIHYEAFREEQRRKPRVGDSVWQNYPLLYLPDVSNLIVKTQVREVDLHKIALNQSCAVRVDAYPEVAYAGEVAAIGALAAARAADGSGDKYFQLTVTLQGEDLRLRPGMTARVSIVAEEVRDALSVPIHAVFQDGGGHWVYVAENGRLRRTAVKLGRQSEDWAEVLEGLSENQQVSLARPPQEP